MLTIDLSKQMVYVVPGAVWGGGKMLFSQIHLKASLHG